MTPFYMPSGLNLLFAIYESPASSPKDTAVLIVPPFGTEDMASYGARKDWSMALAAHGFASLRIDLPGTGDSSGTPRDPGLVKAWSAAICDSVDWLRHVGHPRIAVVAMGAGCLIALEAACRGMMIDDLVLWSLPLNGTKLLREMTSLARINQTRTGEPLTGSPTGELNICGHLLTAETVADLKKLDAPTMIAAAPPKRALLISRDGARSAKSVVSAFQKASCDLTEDDGLGWRAMVEDLPGLSPTPTFKIVSRWLEQTAAPGHRVRLGSLLTSVELGPIGNRIRERPITPAHGSQQLFAVITEPVDRPRLDITIIFFNAGSLRRIGPNRMWVEAARRWGAKGVSALRLDVAGIGDAGGDHQQYADINNFYTRQFVEQCRAALEFAVANGLPDRFLLCGLCAGAFAALQVALADRRARGILAFSQRTTSFGPQNDMSRDLRRLTSTLRPGRLRRLLGAKNKLHRLRQLTGYLVQSPQQLFRALTRPNTETVPGILKILERQGQRMDMAFSKEWIAQELAAEMKSSTVKGLPLTIHELPYASHSLTPFQTQQAAHVIIDQVVGQMFDLS